jgi:hypothetical protein
VRQQVVLGGSRQSVGGMKVKLSSLIPKLLPLKSISAFEAEHTRFHTEL